MSTSPIGQLLTSALTSTNVPLTPSSLVSVPLTSQETNVVQTFLSSSPDTLSTLNALFTKFIKNFKIDTQDVPTLVLEFVNLIKSNFPKYCKANSSRIVLLIQTVTKIVVNSNSLNLTPGEKQAILYAVDGSLSLLQAQITGKVTKAIKPKPVKSKRGFLSFLFNCRSNHAVDPSANSPTEVPVTPKIPDVEPVAPVTVPTPVATPPAPKRIPMRLI